MSGWEREAPASSVQSLRVSSAAPGSWRSITHAPHGRYPAPRRSSSVPSSRAAVTPGSLRSTLAPSPLGAGGRARQEHGSQVYRALDSAGAVRSRSGPGSRAVFNAALGLALTPLAGGARLLDSSSKRPTAGRLQSGRPRSAAAGLSEARRTGLTRDDVTAPQSLERREPRLPMKWHLAARTARQNGDERTGRRGEPESLP